MKVRVRTGVEGTGMSCILKRNVKCGLQITDPNSPNSLCKLSEFLDLPTTGLYFFTFIASVTEGTVSLGR